MNAAQLFEAGQLRPAIDAQVQAVKSRPADSNARLFLFELLAFAGEWDRARRQLEAVRYEELPQVRAVEMYRLALDAEQLRRQVFAGSGLPETLVAPPPHLLPRLEALQHLRSGRPADALRHLEKAEAQLAPLHGTLNGHPFSSLRDADDLLGPVLEVLWRGRYYWVPLDQVIALALNEPRTPRDLLWAQARMMLHGGWNDMVMIPTLYVGTSDHPDDAVKLGRVTDWRRPADGPTLGVGSRLFQVGEQDVPLLEWRQLVMASPGS